MMDEVVVNITEITEDVSVIIAEINDNIVVSISEALQGEAGSAGPIGERGPTGNDGAAGVKGDKGNDGSTGLQGPIGPEGIAGPQGAPGNDGVRGDKGDTGAQGIQGVQGDPGSKGDTGNVGPQGPIGNMGPQGPAGDMGPQGIPGLKGDRGDTGERGLQGDAGTPGLQGIQGEAGSQGVQGVKGDTGNAGPQGEAGLQGIQGPAGSDATVTRTAVEAVLTGVISSHSHTGGSDPWTIVKLASDFVTSGTANANITGFNFTPAANKQYLILGYFSVMTAVTTTGARPGIAWPTGTTFEIGWITSPTSATAFVSRLWGAPSTANAAGTAIAVINEGYFAKLEAMIIAGPSISGNFQITLASEIAASNVTMRAGSILMYREL